MDLDIKILPGENGTVKVMLQGDLSIRNASAIKAALLEGVAKQKAIQVELLEVTALDLSLVQLLHAVRQENLQSTVTVKDLESSIVELIKRAGLESVFA